MSIDKKFVLKALLQHNYLPSLKKDKGDLPPIIDSESFTESLARKLGSLPSRRLRGYPGYDAVDYKLTRFNGVTRICSIPHPRAYAALALSIATNWGYLEYITTNIVSKVIPHRHKDGRIVVMDYENTLSQVDNTLNSSFGRRYSVKTDISNCYPSIYSHAIPWATVGFDESKHHISSRNKWYNKIDKALRATKRNETTGIAVGPATSTILAEAILARVDCTLTKKFTYTRYIDDYTAYCDSIENAEEFIFDLADELAKYKLGLNIGKTEIKPLPLGSRQDWVIDLNNAFPKKGKISAHAAVTYLDFAVRISDQVPDGSVLKYALKSLVRRILKDESEVDEQLLRMVLRYALNLSFHRSVLIPLLERPFDAVLTLDGKFTQDIPLLDILCEHVRSRRSDAISWLLYFCIKYSVPIKNCCSDRIVKSQDCIPMLLLYKAGNSYQQKQVIDFANSLDKKDLYAIDRYWLLLYQLFLDGRIFNPYQKSQADVKVFETMKANGVNFILPPPTP